MVYVNNVNFRHMIICTVDLVNEASFSCKQKQFYNRWYYFKPRKSFQPYHVLTSSWKKLNSNEGFRETKEHLITYS